MREISPFKNASIDEFLPSQPQWIQDMVEKIRDEKRAELRKRPSESLVGQSAILSPDKRARLIDRVAALVDENLFGRAEMCIQFAQLLQLSLVHLGFGARTVIGTAEYYAQGRKIFSWEHSWVRIGSEVVDGNVDSLYENPTVPSTVQVAPYWGPITSTPHDRRLRETKWKKSAPDGDVLAIWWPELRAWLEAEV